MRIIYGMGPHAHGAQGQSMANCPMDSTSGGAHQQGAMMGEGHMMADGHMMPGMQHGDMTNCPMAQQGAEPAASDAPPPADAHQH